MTMGLSQPQVTWEKHWPKFRPQRMPGVFLELHGVSIWQAAGSRADSGMKLRATSWDGKTSIAHLPVQVFPISPTFATLHGKQHLQALGLHPH